MYNNNRVVVVHSCNYPPSRLPDMRLADALVLKPTSLNHIAACIEYYESFQRLTSSFFRFPLIRSQPLALSRYLTPAARHIRQNHGCACLPGMCQLGVPVYQVCAS